MDDIRLFNLHLSECHEKVVMGVEIGLQSSIAAGKLQLAVLNRDLVKTLKVDGPYTLSLPEQVKIKRPEKGAEVHERSKRYPELVEAIINDGGRETIESVEAYRARLTELHALLLVRLAEKVVEETKAGRLDQALAIRDFKQQLEATGPFDPVAKGLPAPAPVEPGQEPMPDQKIRDERRPGKPEDNSFGNPARFVFDGHVNLGKLHLGELIHSNRANRFVEIPPEFADWQFTLHDIKTTPTYEIDVIEPGFVAVCFGTFNQMQNSAAFFDDGWTKVYEIQMDDSTSRANWVFAAKRVNKGRYSIPVGHPHSGTLVLVPPNN